MNFKEIEQVIENMTDEQIEELLNTEMPEDLEKQAEEHLVGAELADALYAFGGLLADADIASIDGVEKVAAETAQELEAANQEIEQIIDQAVETLGIEELDSTEMHKQAQAAASIILDGYTDFLEKEAAKKGPGMVAKVKKMLSKGYARAGEAAQGAKKHLKKHKGLYGSAAGGMALGAGGMALKKHMDKKASEATLAELAEVASELTSIKIASEMELDAVVSEGLEKIAAKGAKKGMLSSLLSKGKKGLKSGMEAAKKYKKHMGVGALGAAAGAGGMHLMSKKDKR